MSRRDLMQRLVTANVTLRIKGNALHYRAPAGAMTPELRAALVEHKPDILHDYEERAAIMEYDGGLDRSEAERLAAAEVFNNTMPDGQTNKEEEQCKP